MRPYYTLKALRRGEPVCVEGMVVVKANHDEVRPGDLYVGERNTAKIDYCRTIHDDGWVVPEGKTYPFDLHEILPVVEAPEGSVPTVGPDEDGWQRPLDASLCTNSGWPDYKTHKPWDGVVR